MTLEPLFRRVDRIAGGRDADYRVAAEACGDRRTRKAFTVVAWLLVLELVIGAGAVAVALDLFHRGETVPPVAWMRGVVVLGMTVTLFYFLWRARLGYYWGYSRLRLFSKIFPVVTLLLAAIPGLFPAWMVTEQILFSVVLIGVAGVLDSEHMRAAFPKPRRRGGTARGAD